ncbi:MAG: hypothetical protein M0R46_08625 [Candidatus Muirbacterium halophilum]|nr:hypothetical protein [Candidatus Muirbacterium halophilum]
MEKDLKLMHFEFEGIVNDVCRLERKFLRHKGVHSVDVILAEKVIYFTIDTDVVQVDSLIEMIQIENLKII